MYQGKKAAEWVDVLVNDASARQRALAASALGKIWAEYKYEPALTTLGRAIRLDTSPAVRVQALTVIAGLEPDVVKRPLGTDKQSVADDLVAAAKAEKEPRVRKELAATMSFFPDAAKNAVDALTGYLKDAEPATRASAATALGRVGVTAKPALGEFLPLLNDTEPSVRRAAVFALARIAPDDTAAGSALARLLATEKERDVRREIVISLGLFTERSGLVVQAVAGMLTDADIDTRRAAVRALGRFGTSAGPAADDILKVAKSDKDKDVRVDAVRAFAAVVGPEGLKARVKDVFPILDGDPDYEVRLAAVEELGALGNAIKGDAETLAALQKRLNDPSAKVRTAAADAIRRIETLPKAPEKKP
jgi:HEAT repeat protein